MAFSSDLERLLARWLPRQRWFPELGGHVGQEPDLIPLSVVRVAEAQDQGSGTVQVMLAVLSVGAGDRSARISLPLTFRTREELSLRSHRIGEVDDLLLGPIVVYDGAADPVGVQALIDLIDSTADLQDLHVSGHRAGEELGAAPQPVPPRPAFPPPEAPATDVDAVASDTTPPVLPGDTAAAGRLLSDAPAQDGVASAGPDPLGSTDTAAELAATDPVGDRLLERAASLRVRLVPGRGHESRTEIDTADGTSYVLTVVRKLDEGTPPAVRVPLALTAVGSSTVHPVVGWVDARWFDAARTTTMTAPIAMLVHALPDSYPAWQDAVGLAMRVDSGSVGSFNRQAAALGTVVGELHGDLAGEFGLVQSGGEPTERLVGKWRNRVEWALAAAPGALAGLGESLREHARILDELDTVGPLQRIHGELTLDHILTGTAEGPRVISFSTSTDDEPGPTALDLVALLRSVDYAAGYSWLRRIGALEDLESPLRRLSAEGLAASSLRAEYLSSPERLWCGQAVNSLLSGYSHAVGTTASLSDPVLRAALIDRLLVEVVTEQRNRPVWLIVPLAALSTLLGEPETVPAAGEESESSQVPSGPTGPAAPDVLPSAAGVLSEVDTDIDEEGDPEDEAGDPEAEAVSAAEAEACVRAVGEDGSEVGAETVLGPEPESEPGTVDGPRPEVAGGSAVHDGEANDDAAADVPATGDGDPPEREGRRAGEVVDTRAAGVTGPVAGAAKTNAFGLPVDETSGAAGGGPSPTGSEAVAIDPHAAARHRETSSASPAAAASEPLTLPSLVDMPAAGTPPAVLPTVSVTDQGKTPQRAVRTDPAAAPEDEAVEAGGIAESGAPDEDLDEDLDEDDADDSSAAPHARPVSARRWSRDDVQY